MLNSGGREAATSPDKSSGFSSMTENQLPTKAKRKDRERPGYDAALLVPSSGDAEASSFEEHRARNWWKHNRRLTTKIASSYSHRTPTAVDELPSMHDLGFVQEQRPALPDNNKQDCSHVSTGSPRLQEPLVVSPLQPTTSPSPAASPSITLNTRAAMEEINSMFQAQLPCDPFDHRTTVADDQANNSLTESEPAGATADDMALQGEELKRYDLGRAVDELHVESNPVLSAAAVESGSLPESTPEGRQPGMGELSSSQGASVVPVNIIDPFDDALQPDILAKLDPPLLQRGQWECVNCDVGDDLLEALAVFEEFAESEEFTEMGGQPLCVRRILGRGAYATCFEVDLMDDRTGEIGDSLAVVKVQQPACLWEFYIGRALSGRLEDSRNAMRFINMKRLHVSSAASFLVTNLGTYGTLQDLVNAHRMKGQ
eukprot:scaffold262196_cov46-Prasinocladus_malaysianus.AAC.1